MVRAKNILIVMMLHLLFFNANAQQTDSLKTIKKNKTISIVSASTAYVATNSVLYFACYSFVVDLTFLGGKALLQKHTKNIFSLVEY